jgi:exodeoxyribonuclease V alpha subunit
MRACGPHRKAAVRMAESLKASAMRFDPAMQEKFRSLVPATIHRLLKYIPDSPYFRHNKAIPCA